MPSLRMSTRAAALAVAASGAIFSIPAVSSASTVRAAAATTGCSLPVVHDVYDGFHVGVPAGWDLSTLGGEISVAPSPASSEGAVLYPALLTKGVTAASVFSAFMGHEQKLVQGEKAVFNMLPTHEAGAGLPAASVTAKVNGTALSGQASVIVLPLGTHQASREAVVSLGYAPASQWAAAAGTLTGIGRCYGAERGALFAVFQGNPFTFIMPPGWHVGPEGQDYVELENSANTASATYELWARSSRASTCPSRSVPRRRRSVSGLAGSGSRACTCCRRSPPALTWNTRSSPPRCRAKPSTA